MSEITVELRDGFNYTNKGDVHKATFINLTPPAFKQMSYVTPIKQAFTAAISEIQSNQKVKAEPGQEKGEASITASEVVALMHSWSGDMVKVNLWAQGLFKQCALIEGEVSMTTPLIEKMSMYDFENLLGSYIANFIIPSLMDG